MRISEVYASVQGEGPRVGEPTIFVRFAGCNLRCPKWPCDTPHAIDPQKYRSEWVNVTPGELAKRVVETGPPHYNVCLTGGEPFLQLDDELKVLIEDLQEAGFLIFEAFTNGTIEWPEWTDSFVSRVMDWKLAGSGEAILDEFGTRYARKRYNNLLRMDGGDALKFTIADRKDFDEARAIWADCTDIWNELERKSWEEPQVFYGPVWGKVAAFELVRWALEAQLPWRLNLQVHNIIWDRTKRGI